MWNYDFTNGGSDQPQNLAVIDYVNKLCTLSAQSESKFKVKADEVTDKHQLALCAWVDWGVLALDDFLSTGPMSGLPWTCQVYFVSLPIGHKEVLANVSIDCDSNKFQIDVTTV